MRKLKKAKSRSFLDELSSGAGNLNFLYDDGEEATEYINTGCYALNGLISGDIHKGIPNNSMICLGGEESTGKTYLTIGILREAIKVGYNIVYFDSETAVNYDMLAIRGVPKSRVKIFRPITAEDLRLGAQKIVELHDSFKTKDKPKILVVVDSLGNLSTKKEVADISKDTGKKDMTRAQVLKSIFRAVGNQLCNRRIPMIMTNHVYATMDGYVSEKEMSGGSGPKYFAHTILFLRKKKAKDESKQHHGVHILARSKKNRFAKEEKKVRLLLDYEKGLHPYFGLQGELHANKEQTLTNYCEPILTKKNISGHTWIFKDKEIKQSELFDEKNIEKYWNKEVLEVVRENMLKDLSYGKPDLEEIEN